MAANADVIRQFLANSALMMGERQLLRKQPESKEDRPKSTAQPNAAPIVPNSKTAEAVLLTLLDEQLHASKTHPANRLQNSLAAASDNNTSTRIAARYAADDLNSGDEPLLAGATHTNDQPRISSTPTAVSGDLQTFMQRSAALAAGRANENAGGMRNRYAPNARRLFNGASPLPFAGGAIALILIAVFVAKWLML